MVNRVQTRFTATRLVRQSQVIASAGVGLISPALAVFANRADDAGFRKVIAVRLSAPLRRRNSVDGPAAGALPGNRSFVAHTFSAAAPPGGSSGSVGQ